MSVVEKSIEVRMPVSTVYNQWTQFEDFPRFMEGIEIVKQLDDKHLHWVASVGGKKEEWDAEITQQIPDRRIAWESETGATNAGLVTFEPVDAISTRVSLQLAYEPKNFVENVGDVLGFVCRRVEGDLTRFKEFIESRGVETCARRGTIRE